MNFKKKIARKTLLPIGMKLGLDKAIRQLSGHSILNIMYHGVTNEDVTWFSPRHLNKDQFEQQLIYLKKNFDIIPIAEAFYLVQNNIKPKRKSITISFDDGYQNNLQTALPLLEEYHISATFFISGVCAEDMPVRCIWPDLICALDYFNKNTPIEIGNLKFVNLIEAKSGEHLFDFLKKAPYPERDKIVEKLTLEYGLADKMKQVPEEAWKLMTKEEIIELAGSTRAQIGSHGYLHYNLANVDTETAAQELVRSKSILESLVNTEVFMLAYPDGSYNDAVKNIAEQTGYRYQLAVAYKNPSDVNDHRILNRHGISSTTTFESNMIALSLAFRTRGH